MAGRTSLCTFYVADLFLGVDLLRVQEVNQHLELTYVPLAPSMVRGLINLRGQIVTVLDLRDRLGLPPRAEGMKPMSVVLSRELGVVSFLVDGVGDVIEADPDDFESPPPTLDENIRGFVRAVCKQPDTLLLILDPDQVIGGNADAA